MLHSAFTRSLSGISRNEVTRLFNMREENVKIVVESMGAKNDTRKLQGTMHQKQLIVVHKSSTSDNKNVIQG